MKRITLFSIIIIFTVALYAQNEEKTVTLEEVTVKGAKVINKVDGRTIYPTEAQKNSSANGYDILQKLSLPNIRIENANHTISAIDNRGMVQLRINGIIIGKQELISLDTRLICRIDFIDNPGVRYGDGIAYVINIITRRHESGYTIGTDLSSTLTTMQGEGSIYGKYNVGKSEFSLSYGINGHKLKGLQNIETARYTLTDGTIYTIKRNDIETLREGLQHDIKLIYNIADSTKYVFQASLGATINKTPCDNSTKIITEQADTYVTTSKENGSNHSPVIDLYYSLQITPKQSVTANAVGTYISTNSFSFYDEGNPYQYNVDGKSMSAISEVIYENRLKPFTLSMGLNHRYKYTKNLYTGDTSALTKMFQNNIYVFSEIKGMIKTLRYSLGTGVSYIHYNQIEHKYNYWTFRPKLSLVYNINREMQFNYTYQLWDRVSRIAMISDASIRTNSMEWTVGNPDLKPSRTMNHRLQLSYNTEHLLSFIEGYYKQCHKPNMAHYERTSDNKFLYTQTNQKEIDLLHISAYSAYWILPEKLQIAIYGGLQRCFNYGYDYTHHYSSWFYVSSATAFLGPFSLRLYSDNGNKFLEGEHKGFNGAYTALQASYKKKDFQLSLTLANPFGKNYKSQQSELLNCNLNKLTTTYNNDIDNCLTFNISWKLSQGKKFKSRNKTINLKDTDTGIITK
ncbi:MAG: TonB-dependent receptor plug domain-containing protein [Prevotella sp.]